MSSLSLSTNRVFRFFLAYNQHPLGLHEERNRASFNFRFSCFASASFRRASLISSICLDFIILLSICPSWVALTIERIVIILS